MTGPRIPSRPGAPTRREPPRFNTPARAGTYDGLVIGATCGNCTKCDRRRFAGKVEIRCGIAVAAARVEGRRLPDTVGAGRPACSRFKARRGRR